LTGAIGPLKPAASKFSMMKRPAEHSRVLAPISAMDRGWKIASRLRMDIMSFYRQTCALFDDVNQNPPVVREKTMQN
jgi:predicted methyltransferase MtxX (methanogen marker protein 4)